MKTFKISNYKIGVKYPVFIIAEAGINHNGSLSIAKKMVDVAKSSGVSCIKFQTHIANEEMIQTNMLPGKISKRTLWNIIKDCELSDTSEEKLFKYCKQKKILALSTPFSISAVERLEKLSVPAYKIGSGEITNIPFLNQVAKTNKPIILSSGMSTLNEIKIALKIFKKNCNPISLLHTTSIYPTQYKDVRLGLIEKYKKLFGIPIGISDHSIGIYTAIASVGLGASIIEKHFTLDKKMDGPDQKISLSPDELSELVIGCNAIKSAMGNTKSILPDEKPVMKFARESVVTIKNISSGQIFTTKNISTKRPGDGKIPAKSYLKILGKKAKKSIKNNVQLSPNDVI